MVGIQPDPLPVGYAAIQSTRPQLIAYGLTDSPVFKLAWIADGFKQWTDSTDSPEDAVDRARVLPRTPPATAQHPRARPRAARGAPGRGARRVDCLPY
jgi:hypothetical protein